MRQSMKNVMNENALLRWIGRTGIGLSILSTLLETAAFAGAFPGSANYVRLEQADPVNAIKLVNNYPFPIQETVRFPVSAGSDTAAAYLAVDDDPENQSSQALHLEKSGGQTWAWMSIELKPGETRRYSIQP